MKLPGINYKWQVTPLAKRDIYAPQKVAYAQAQVASAQAGSARAWAGAAGSEANASRAMAKVYEDVGGYVTKAAMQIQEESFETEAQSAYNNSLAQINELENKLYTSKALAMDDPMMNGVSYDDSYTVVDGDKVVTKNSGNAPTREVGQQVWATQSQAIMRNFSSGMSKGAQKIYASKIQAQIQSKTQNMGRHVLNMNVAHAEATTTQSIAESNRAGDTAGAIRIADEALNRGIYDQKKRDAQVNSSLQEGDLMRFNQELSLTNDDASLARLSNTALFSDSYMTTAQKVQSSNAALSKIRQNQQDMRQKVADWRDNNTMNAIIAHYKGDMSVTDLNQNPDAYGRSNFTQLFNRMTKPTPIISDQSALRSFGQQIIDAPFNNMDPEEQYRDIRFELGSAVKRGDIQADDYVKLTEMMDKQAKAPFNRQPYQEAKKALFVDILGTLDAKTMEEINGAGVNIDGMMLKKLGQSANVSQLAMRAFEDMNAYVRQYGGNADPVKWWKDNKESYKVDKDSVSQQFQAYYPNDTITLHNGKVDITSTENKIVNAYRNGEYGVVGSNEALMEFSKRAATLKGFDPKDISQ